uniref:MAM domain-containing protein n=1 Tax=Ciona savignyi TaxID=51511 RepID=H2Z3J7_CIOSA
MSWPVSILLFALFMIINDLQISAGQNASNCSVAFYPLTACMDNGERANYIQFEDCDFSTSQVRYAWLDVIPLNRAISSKRNKRSAVTWTEIRISSSLTRSGRLTIFYTKNGTGMEGIQMVIPACQ